VATFIASIFKDRRKRVLSHFTKVLFGQPLLKTLFT
jgi:hypothetical protein